jgi:hypothetical protein
MSYFRGEERLNAPLAREATRPRLATQRQGDTLQRVVIRPREAVLPPRVDIRRREDSIHQFVLRLVPHRNESFS